MRIDPRILHIVEEVDAMVHSGDALHTQESLDHFKMYIRNWKREIKKIQILMNKQTDTKLFNIIQQKEIL